MFKFLSKPTKEMYLHHEVVDLFRTQVEDCHCKHVTSENLLVSETHQLTLLFFSAQRWHVSFPLTFHCHEPVIWTHLD